MLINSLIKIKKKIDPGSKIVLFVRLKGLFNEKSNYKLQTENLLNIFREVFRPSEIYVPTFTYSFTKKLFFNVKSTPSEVGRFSEEIRRIYQKKCYRIFDPVFSLIETENGLFKDEDINNNAFGKQSIWKYLNNQKHYVVNINLDSPIIATQLHYLEYENKVQYRYMKYFNGSVQNWDNIKSNVKYGYYVRNIKINPSWNRKKILKICQDKKFVLESGPVKFFEWFKLSKFLKKKLSLNSNYLIT
jgi:aminoglycoside N3'-acetyltransferase